jgi:hypothetical protein
MRSVGGCSTSGGRALFEGNNSEKEMFSVDTWLLEMLLRPDKREKFS